MLVNTNGKNMNISYAVTVCDEFVEMRKLMNTLSKSIQLGDEIIILIDVSKPDSLPIKEWLVSYNSTSLYNIKILETEFKGDFSAHKNLLSSYCSCEYIFQLDADELPPVELMSKLPSIVSAYPTVDLFYVPRINIVEGITLDYVNEQRWNVSKLESFVDGKHIENITDGTMSLLRHYNLIISETDGFVEYYEPIINAWDYQSRIYKNKPSIKWSGKVHETIVGSEKHTKLPMDEDFALYHYKSFERQISQNDFYESL